MEYGLPKTVEIENIKYDINTDFRDILQIINVLNDPNLDDNIKCQVVFEIFFSDKIPKCDYEILFKKLYEFINLGEEYKEEENDIYRPILINWEQDYQIIVSDINSNVGFEIRELEYMHWWTFIGYFKGLGEGQLSSIVSIRDKLAKGKKLEKHEQEFYTLNKDIVKIKEKLSEEQMEYEKELLEKWR